LALKRDSGGPKDPRLALKRQAGGSGGSTLSKPNFSPPKSVTAALGVGGSSPPSIPKKVSMHGVVGNFPIRPPLDNSKNLPNNSSGSAAPTIVSSADAGADTFNPFSSSKPRQQQPLSFQPPPTVSGLKDRPKDPRLGIMGGLTSISNNKDGSSNDDLQVPKQQQQQQQLPSLLSKLSVPEQPPSIQAPIKKKPLHPISTPLLKLPDNFKKANETKQPIIPTQKPLQPVPKKEITNPYQQTPASRSLNKKVDAGGNKSLHAMHHILKSTNASLAKTTVGPVGVSSKTNLTLSKTPSSKKGDPKHASLAKSLHSPPSIKKEVKEEEMSPLTCASLGNSDKVIRAELAVQKFTELAAKVTSKVIQKGLLPDKASADGTAESVVLPTKQQIIACMAGIDMKIQNRKRETDKIKAEIKKAVHNEEIEKELERKREEEEKERQRKAEMERLEREKKEEEARERERIQREKEEKERQRKIELEKQREREKRERGLLSKKEAQKRKLEELENRLQESKKEEECRLENMKDSVIKKAIADNDEVLANSKEEAEGATRNAKRAKTVVAEMEASAKATEEATSAEQALADEFVSEPPIVGNFNSNRDSAIVNEVLDTILARDAPGEMAELVSSILTTNQQCAAKAHTDSLSVIPFTPFPIRGGNFSSERAVSPEAVGSGNGVDGINGYNVTGSNSNGSLRHRTNAEWSNMVRHITGPADALYTEPSEAPFFKEHGRQHIEIAPMIKEHIKAKKRKLRKRWEDLAVEYYVRQDIYSAENPTNDEATAASSTNAIDGANASRSTHSYRRPRRGMGAACSQSGMGASDVVRSEYEQEQIIAEITAKEAMEKRITHGGSALPRQRCQLEKELYVSYRNSQSSRRIFDPLLEEEERRNVSAWSDMEKCIFLDRFLQHPKDFRKIASFLRNKTTKDCVSFYYDSKQSIPYKAALKEHLQRKKRRGDVSWEATIQAALSVGAVITAGTSPEKPLVFKLPQGDNTFYTRNFHPMKRELFDDIDTDTGSYKRAKRLSKGKPPPPKASVGTWFSLDKAERTFLRTVSEDNIAGMKKRISDTDLTAGSTKTIPKTIPKIITSHNVLSDACDTVKGSSSEVAGGGNNNIMTKKIPQKWSQSEKKLFFETIDKHGKDWSMLASAIPSKSTTQIKNYYYDHKKQFGKQRNKSEENKSEAGSPSPKAMAPSETSPNAKGSVLLDSLKSGEKSISDADKASDTAIKDDVKHSAAPLAQNSTPSPAPENPMQDKATEEKIDLMMAAQGRDMHLQTDSGVWMQGKHQLLPALMHQHHQQQQKQQQQQQQQMMRLAPQAPNQNIISRNHPHQQVMQNLYFPSRHTTAQMAEIRARLLEQRDWVDGPGGQHMANIALALGRAGHLHSGYPISPSSHMTLAGLAAMGSSSVQTENKAGGGSSGEREMAMLASLSGSGHGHQGLSGSGHGHQGITLNMRHSAASPAPGAGGVGHHRIGLNMRHDGAPSHGNFYNQGIARGNDSGGAGGNNNFVYSGHPPQQEGKR